jgi:predicted nucleotidyltransferase
MLRLPALHPVDVRLYIWSGSYFTNGRPSSQVPAHLITSGGATSRELEAQGPPRANHLVPLGRATHNVLTSTHNVLPYLVMHTSRNAALTAAILALHRTSPLRKNEIARLTGLEWSAVQRGVESLRSRGLLDVEDSKGYETYRLSAESPYYPALVKAALVDIGIIEALAPFARRLRFVSVIGSFAWGRPGPTSDLDLLVVGGVDKRTIDTALEPLASRIERTIDTIVYADEEMNKRLSDDDYLLADSIATGIRLMGDPSLVPA